MLYVMRIIQDNSLISILTVTIGKNTQCISSSPDDRHSGRGQKVCDPPHLHPALPKNSLCPLTCTVPGTGALQVSSGHRTSWIVALWSSWWYALLHLFWPTRCKVPLFVQYWNNYQCVPKHSACLWWSKLSKWWSKGEETACWNIQMSFGVQRAENCNRQWKWYNINIHCSEILNFHMFVSKLNTAEFTVQFNSSFAVRTVTLCWHITKLKSNHVVFKQF